MRLIDADELLEHTYRDKLNSRELIAQMIENAPTVKSIPIKFPLQLIDRLIKQVQELEQAQKYSEEREIKPISYIDCSNAMMKMWIDNVVTDGEYNRIMDKLNDWKLNGGENGKRDNQ